MPDCDIFWKNSLTPFQRFLPSCSSVWFAVFFFGFPPPELKALRMSITPMWKLSIGDKVKTWNTMNLKSVATVLELNLLESSSKSLLPWHFKYRSRKLFVVLSLIKVAISEKVNKQIICPWFLIMDIMSWMWCNLVIYFTHPSSPSIQRQGRISIRTMAK